MKLPQNFTRKSFAVIGFSVAIYAAVALYFGFDEISSQLKGFPARSLWLLAGLSMVNYCLRFWRWEIYLRRLGHPLPLGKSLGLYFSTYVMVITPGKIGEIFKAGILRERFGISLSVGIPIVVAERIYDFLAVLVLAVCGVFFWPGSLTGMTTGLAASAGIPVLLFLFQNKTVRTKLLSKVSASKLLARHKLGIDDSLESLARLMTPSQMAFSLGLSVLAWVCECLGLWLVCRELGFPVPVFESIFIYAAGTLVGSLSFLPGGLGGTEATLIWLLGSLGMAGVMSATAALLIRLFTLWLAVVLGLVVFMFWRRDLLSPPE